MRRARAVARLAAGSLGKSSTKSAVGDKLRRALVRIAHEDTPSLPSGGFVGPLRAVSARGECDGAPRTGIARQRPTHLPNRFASLIPRASGRAPCGPWEIKISRTVLWSQWQGGRGPIVIRESKFPIDQPRSRLRSVTLNHALTVETFRIGSSLTNSGPIPRGPLTVRPRSAHGR